MRGRYQMEVRLAPAQYVKTARAEGVTRFGPAQPLRAAVYPISFTREAQAYGLRPCAARRLLLPRGAAAAPGDGVWLRESYPAGGQRPPWQVRLVRQWPGHVEAIVEKTGFASGGTE